MKAKKRKPKPQPRGSNGRWAKVHAPKMWRPGPGEILTGSFGGTSKRKGSYGEYTVVLVRNGRHTWMVSGVQVVTKVHAGQFEIGEPIEIVFEGRVDLDAERTMKTFEVYFDADYREEHDRDEPAVRLRGAE